MDQWLRVYLTSPAGDEVELSTLNTYNGYKLLDGVRGFGIPKRSLETVAVEGAGSILQSQRFDESEMMLPVAVRADTEDEVATLVRALEAVLAPASDEPIVIRVEAPGLGTVRRRRAYYVEGLEGALGGADQYGPWRHMQVKLNAIDPVWFGETRTITEQVKTQRKPFISTVGTTKPVNLLPNGSFERGMKQGELTTYAGGGSSLEVDTEWAATGTRSVKNTPSGSSSATAFYPFTTGMNAASMRTAFSTLGLIPGAVYTVGATYRQAKPQASNANSEARRITLHTTRSSTGDTISQINGYAVAPNEAGEHRISASFTLPDDCDGLAVRLFSGGRNADDVSWWDDLYLYEGSPTDTRQMVYRTNLALNPGMERNDADPFTFVEGQSWIFDQTEHVSGARSVKVISEAGGGTPHIVMATAPVKAASSLSGSIMLKATAGVTHYRLSWWRRDGAWTPAAQGAEKTVIASRDWALVKTPVLTSVQAGQYALQVQMLRSVGGQLQDVPAGDAMWCDELIVEAGTYVGLWFSDQSTASGKVYSRNPDGSSQEAAKSTTGSVPFFPIRLSGSSVQGEYDLDIGGDLPTWGVYTITGPGKDPVLTCGDKTMAITGDVTEPITIDMNPRVADITTPTLQSGEMWDRAGEVVAGQIENADFWQLEPGTVHLGMSMVDATNISTIKVEYTERWLAAY
jgi:hypothetical protein